MEQLISFETAKIAKEKKCDLQVNLVYYFAPKEITGDEEDGFSKNVQLFSHFKNSNDSFYISAPTQSRLQTWLRNEKKILVLVNPIDSWDSWKYTILMKDIMSPFFEPQYDKTNEFPTYEDALEEGLKVALQLLD